MIFFSAVATWLVMYYRGTVHELHNDQWLVSWSEWVSDQLAETLDNRMVLAILLLVPVLVLAIIIELFCDWFFGLFGLLITLLVLFYSFGRGDYEAEVSRYHNALINAGDLSIEAQEAEGRHNSTRASLTYRAYERWFATIFWFLLLGAPGALFYRLVSLLASVNTKAGSDDESASVLVPNASFREQAIAILGWLDFLPARVWGFASALVGDFSAAIVEWQKRLLLTESTANFLDAVSVKASALSVRDADADDFDADLAAEEIELISSANQRTMVVMLVFVVLLIAIV